MNRLKGKGWVVRVFLGLVCLGLLCWDDLQGQAFRETSTTEVSAPGAAADVVPRLHRGNQAVPVESDGQPDRCTHPGRLRTLDAVLSARRSASGDPLENAGRKNVEIGVERLQGLEPIVAPRVKGRKVKVVGGVYDLLNGAVTLIDTKK